MTENCNNPDSFVFYRSFYKSIENLEEAAQLELYKAIAGFALDHIEPYFKDSDFRPYVEAIFEGVRPQLEVNRNRWINGQKGGCPKGTCNNPNGRRGKGTNQELTKNKPNINNNVNKNVNENNIELNFPFSDSLFFDTWSELRQQPKWKDKTITALQKSLDQLGKYPVEFSIELMNTAIANNWQGVVFPNTPKVFEEWKRSKHTNTEETPITDITKLFEK